MYEPGIYSKNGLILWVVMLSITGPYDIELIEINLN